MPDFDIDILVDGHATVKIQADSLEDARKEVQDKLTLLGFSGKESYIIIEEEKWE